MATVSITVSACSECPFVRTRKDYCIVGSQLGLVDGYGVQRDNLWINSYYIDNTIHPDCPLRFSSLTIQVGQADQFEVV